MGIDISILLKGFASLNIIIIMHYRDKNQRGIK